MTTLNTKVTDSFDIFSLFPLVSIIYQTCLLVYRSIQITIIIIIKTILVQVDPKCQYKDIIYVKSFEPNFTLAGGINLPKIISCRGSDGVTRRQLVKVRNIWSCLLLHRNGLFVFFFTMMVCLSSSPSWWSACHLLHHGGLFVFFFTMMVCLSSSLHGGLLLISFTMMICFSYPSP